MLGSFTKDDLSSKSEKTSCDTKKEKSQWQLFLSRVKDTKAASYNSREHAGLTSLVLILIVRGGIVVEEVIARY